MDHSDNGKIPQGTGATEILKYVAKSIDFVSAGKISWHSIVIAAIVWLWHDGRQAWKLNQTIPNLTSRIEFLENLAIDRSENGPKLK